MTPYISYDAAFTGSTSGLLSASSVNGFVLSDTYFGASGNLSQVEFVPASDGVITIEVRNTAQSHTVACMRKMKAFSISAR